MKTKNIIHLMAALFCAATLTTTLTACGDDEEDPDPSWWADGSKKPGSNPDDPNNPGSNPDDPNNPGSTPDNPNNPGSNPDDPNNPGSNPDNPNNPGSNPDNPNNPGSDASMEEQVFDQGSTAMQLLSGATRTLQLRDYLDNYVGDQAGWYSSNPEVATVDQEGRATGLSTGRAVITADGQHVRGTFYVQVVDPSTILTLSAGPTSSDGNVLFFSHTDITNWYDDVITLTDIVITNGTQEGTTEYHGLNEVLQPTRYNISAVMSSGFGRNQAQQPGQNILPFSTHFQTGSMPWAIITFTYNNKTFTINTEVQFQ